MSRSTIVRYRASTPAAKYLGSNLRGFTDNLRADVIQPVLEKFSLKEIAPDEWMYAQVQLDMLQEIEALCSFEELVAVGVKSAEYVPLPPELDSIEKLLEASPKLQQMVGQNMSPDERVIVEKLAAHHYRMTLHLPTTPFLMYGYLYGLIKRVKSADQYPTIRIIDDNTPFIFEFKW